MSKISDLRAELLDDPLGRNYAAMFDQVAADSINTVDRVVARSVSSADVRNYLIGQINGAGVNARSSFDMVREYAIDGTVRGASAGETAPEARRSGASMIWLILLMSVDNQFAVDDPAISAQFIAIGPDGGNGPSVLTGAQLNAIDALATGTVSRGVEIGVGTVTSGEVERARREAA